MPGWGACGGEATQISTQNRDLLACTAPSGWQIPLKRHIKADKKMLPQKKKKRAGEMRKHRREIRFVLWMERDVPSGGEGHPGASLRSLAAVCTSVPDVCIPGRPGSLSCWEGGNNTTSISRQGFSIFCALPSHVYTGCRLEIDSLQE